MIAITTRSSIRVNAARCLLMGRISSLSQVNRPGSAPSFGNGIAHTSECAVASREPPCEARRIQARRIGCGSISPRFESTNRADTTMRRATSPWCGPRRLPRSAGDGLGAAPDRERGLGSHAVPGDDSGLASSSGREESRWAEYGDPPVHRLGIARFQGQEGCRRSRPSPDRPGTRPRNRPGPSIDPGRDRRHGRLSRAERPRARAGR